MKPVPFIYVRNSQASDLSFYNSMLRNDAWIHESGFSSDDFVTDQQVLEFMTPHHPLDLKGIATRCDGYQIGFVHFKLSRAGQVEICGGVKPKILNRGLGFLSFVFSIDFYFKTYPCDEIYSTVYQHNERSRKMHLKVGFAHTGIVTYDVRDFDVFILSRQSFYSNSFVNLILAHDYGILC